MDTIIQLLIVLLSACALSLYVAAISYRKSVK